MRILVVEDDPTLLEMYKECLQTSGFETLCVTDGKAALNLVKTFLPDCVLLDILLPIINGFDVLHEIRADKATKNIAVILLTVLAQDSIRQKGLAEGADDFLLKSDTKMSDIIAKIRSAVEKRKTEK